MLNSSRAPCSASSSALLPSYESSSIGWEHGSPFGTAEAFRLSACLIRTLSPLLACCAPQACQASELPIYLCLRPLVCLERESPLPFHFHLHLHLLLLLLLLLLSPGIRRLQALASLTCCCTFHVVRQRRRRWLPIGKAAHDHIKAINAGRREGWPCNEVLGLPLTPLSPRRVAGRGLEAGDKKQEEEEEEEELVLLVSACGLDGERSREKAKDDRSPPWPFFFFSFLWLCALHSWTTVCWCRLATTTKQNKTKQNKTNKKPREPRTCGGIRLGESGE